MVGIYGVPPEQSVNKIKHKNTCHCMCNEYYRSLIIILNSVFTHFIVFVSVQYSALNSFVARYIINIRKMFQNYLGAKCHYFVKTIIKSYLYHLN